MTFGVCSGILFENDFPKVNIQLYANQRNPFEHTKYSLSDVTQVVHHRDFKRFRPTVMFVFGWMMSPDADTSQLVIIGFLNRGDYNVLVLDWSDYSVGMYYQAMINISKISRLAGRSLKKLFDKGINANTFHCVGHSFGAHSCGIMGRELLQVSGRKYKLGRFVEVCNNAGTVMNNNLLNRITGLDPAGRGFYPALFEHPLSPKDATFVDSIHTDVSFVGTKNPTGHVTFYPNYDLVQQPGCLPLKFHSFYDYQQSKIFRERTS